MICVVGSSCDDLEYLLSKSSVISTVEFGRAVVINAEIKCTPFVVLITGYNKVNMGLAKGYVLSNYEIDYLLCAGNCAYIGENNTDLCSIALVEKSLQYDIDSTALGYSATVIPDLSIGTFNSDSTLLILAKFVCNSLCLNYDVGTAATGETFVADNEQRICIKNAYNSDFIDMESGNIGQTGFLFDIPSLTVKGISNYADEYAVSDYERMEKAANKRSNKIILEIIKALQ